MNFILNGQTSLYGIFGYPVRHSKSPTFQTYLFQKYGINAVYVPFEIHPDYIKDAVDSIKILGIKGLNITVPHKEAVLDYLDATSDEIKLIKSVNTIKNENGKLIGYNTDWFGFYESIRNNQLYNKIKTVLVIGAGGSTRAIIFALIKLGVKNILLTNRTISKAENIAKDFKNLGSQISVINFNEIEKYLLHTDMIINTTSVGLHDDDNELFNYDSLQKAHFVFEIIYKDTKLIKKAKEKGCIYQTGHEMLLYQGIKAFEIWTGIYPDEKTISEIRELIIS